MAVLAADRPGERVPGPGLLDRVVLAGPYRLGREAVQVLALTAAERIVVGAQQRADGGAHRAGMVREPLPGEHRGELHHAHRVAGAAVATGVEPHDLPVPSAITGRPIPGRATRPLATEPMLHLQPPA